MRHVAAVPSTAILAGSAIGLVPFELPRAPFSLALALSVAVAVWALARGWTLILGAAVVFGFVVGGALLSSVAWQRAWRPPIVDAFERLAREQRREAEASGRRLPKDDEAFAIVEGTLRSDASAGDAGVLLSVAVEVVEGRDGQDGRDGQEGREGLEGREGREGQEGRDKKRLMEREGFSRASGRATSGGIAVTVVGALAAERINEWRAGRRVRMPVNLRRPSRYLDPGVPDHERDLARRGTRLVGTVKSGALVDVVARADWWSERLADARAFARRAIASHVGRWSPRSAAIVAAVVVGDRSALDEDAQRALQEAGTYHVIAISGGNIAILAGVLVGAFRLAGWLGRWAMVAAIAALGAYAQLVGGGASVDRATLMAIVYFAARVFDQRSPPLNTLAVVAAPIVAWNPLSIVDPAFLLTFAATLAILVSIPALVSARSSTLMPPLRLMWTVLVASVAVETLLMPIGALFFSRVTFAGLALNFVAIPLMAVAQLAGMLVLAVAPVSATVAGAVGWAAHGGAAGLVWSAELVRIAPALTWRVAPPPLSVCGIYYATLSIWWMCWQHRVLVSGSRESDASRWTRRSSAVVAITAALWILFDPRTILAARGDGRLHMTVLDVGQGDAIFLVFPHGSTLLVDAGGLGFASSFDVGDRIVAPVVRAAGFRRIDRLALTHGDPDHIGGALAVLRDLGPREVWEGIPVPRLEALTRLRLEGQRLDTRWSNVYAGDGVDVDGVTIVALHPQPADWERQKVRNDDSLVLELRWRDVSIVLTGDIGRVPEQTLAASIRPSPLRIVKIPHHGSLTSSTPAFVAALRPTVAIVSAGRNNHFGHPVPEVLERYMSAGATVYRTDRDGAVTIDTDGREISVRTYGR